MSRNDEIIHAYNICALVLAILYPRPLSAEEAFAKMDNPHRETGMRAEDAEMLRRAGSSWAEIKELLGMRYPHSAVHNLRKHRRNKKNQKRHQ